MPTSTPTHLAFGLGDIAEVGRGTVIRDDPRVTHPDHRTYQRQLVDDAQIDDVPVHVSRNP